MSMDAIKQALLSNIDIVVANIATDMAVLGSKVEWSMDDNFNTAEGIAALAGTIGLPTMGEDPEDLAFYRAAALDIGLGPSDLGYEHEDGNPDSIGAGYPEEEDVPIEERQWLCRYCSGAIPGERSTQPCVGSPDYVHRRSKIRFDARTGNTWTEEG